MSLNGSSSPLGRFGMLGWQWRDRGYWLPVALGLIYGLLASGSALGQSNDAIRELTARPEYRARLSQFDEFAVRPGDVVLLGDQLIHFGEWDEIFAGVSVRNRGIVGDRADALMLRLNHVIDQSPSVIVLQIGVNDLIEGADVPTVLGRINRLLVTLKQAVPANRLLVIGLPPVTAALSGPIRDYNEQLRDLVVRQGSTYIDIYTPLTGRHGAIYRDYAVDGGVLSGKGYRVVAETLLPYLIKFAGEAKRQATR